MIAESFSMIGHQNDRGLVIDALFAQVGHEFTDDIVSSGDLSVIGVPIFQPELVRRLVRRVRFIDVKEEKERARFMLPNPLLGNLPRFLATALCAADAQRIHIEINAVIPEVETTLDTGLS